MRHRADILHVPIVLKSGNLNLLEPSEPLQACNGIALPLLLPGNRRTDGLDLHIRLSDFLRKDHVKFRVLY